MQTQINKNLRAKIIILMALFLVSITACTSAGPSEVELQATQISSLNRTTIAMAEATNVASASTEQSQAENLPNAQSERIILKNATLTITVDDPEARINEISAMAENMGGWIVTSNVYATTRADGEETTNGSITIRIPADRLNEVLERIKSDTIAVNNENIIGQDVTNEYVDLSSRLKNLEATETQLQRIMETATEVEDVLAVQHELTTVRENIEVIQGRLNFFDEAAAFASVRVDVHPKPQGPIQTQQVGWNPGSTVERSLGALVSILQGLTDLAITLLIIGLPLVVIIGVPGRLLWRSRQRWFPSRPENAEKTNSASQGETN